MSVADDLLARLDDVQERLTTLAAADPAPGLLTDPDEPSGERWEWGQVWAHVAEFPRYWVGQLRAAFARPAGESPPFGRTKVDPGRIAAIERDRTVPTAELHARVVMQLDELRGFIDGMSEDDWARTVHHSTLGEVDMPRAFEVFLVGHLESHADQLDGLVASGGS